MDRSERPHDEVSSSSSSLALLAWAAILIAACAVFFGNLRFGNAVLSVGFEDDFFYYAQVARNLAFHGISSFDGTHLTNGYHPLWLLILTAVTKVFDTGGLLGAKSVTPMAIALETIQVLLIVATAWYSFRVARLYLAAPASSAVQLLAVAGAMMIVRGGMEAGLTIPLAFALLWYRLRPGFDWSNPTVFKYGMLASLLGLSRIDSILLIGLLFLFDLIWHGRSLGDKAFTCGSFLLGLWPLGVYFAINEFVFESLMPISATAKGLRETRWPSVDAMQSFASRLFQLKLPIYAVCVLLTLAVPVLLIMRRRSSPAGSRGVFWAVLMFPPLHFVAVTMLSDWMIWPWYVYAWPIAASFAAIILLRPSQTENGQKSLPAIAFGLAALLLVADAGYLVHSSRPEDELTYLAGEDIAAFAATHPGIYAMGDRAGAPAYLSRVPFIQLEGLMMDPDYLSNIRDGKNVKDVLANYNVRYYISTGATEDAAGCYAVREPMQAGPDSLSMRALICQTPVAKFEHRGFVNHIFDMQ